MNGKLKGTVWELIKEKTKENEDKEVSPIQEIADTDDMIVLRFDLKGVFNCLVC